MEPFCSWRLRYIGNCQNGLYVRESTRTLYQVGSHIMWNCDFLTYESHIVTSITEQSSKPFASGLHDPTYFHFINELSAHWVVFSSWKMGHSCWWQRKRGPLSLNPIGLSPSKQFHFVGSYDKATARIGIFGIGLNGKEMKDSKCVLDFSFIYICNT